MRKSRKVLYTVINVAAFIGGCLAMGIAIQNREQHRKKNSFHQGVLFLFYFGQYPIRQKGETL